MYPECFEKKTADLNQLYASRYYKHIGFSTDKFFIWNIGLAWVIVDLERVKALY